MFDRSCFKPLTHTVLAKVKSEVDQWLCTTFEWDKWDDLMRLVTHNPLSVEIEPENRKYRIGDVGLNARMDLGIETWDSHFFIFDWKCQQVDEKFRLHQLDKYRRQLLTYATYPVFRDFKPLPIENVTACIFNPVEGYSHNFEYNEQDISDFEMQVHDWLHLHHLMFPNPEEVLFDELSGPASPGTVCPHCEFQTICRDDIQWQMQK